MSGGGGLEFVLRTYDSLQEAERAFERLTHCAHCNRLLGGELIHRRAYELPHGCCGLVVLCSHCSGQLQPGSEADVTFRAGLERRASQAAIYQNHERRTQ